MCFVSFFCIMHGLLAKTEEKQNQVFCEMRQNPFKSNTTICSTLLLLYKWLRTIFCLRCPFAHFVCAIQKLSKFMIKFHFSNMTKVSLSFLFQRFVNTLFFAAQLYLIFRSSVWSTFRMLWTNEMKKIFMLMHPCNYRNSFLCT